MTIESRAYYVVRMESDFLGVTIYDKYKYIGNHYLHELLLTNYFTPTEIKRK